MSNYEELRKVIKKKCASEDFDEVNKRIEKIISGKSESDIIRIIKSLICDFEGKLNRNNYVTNTAIVYALLISLFSIANQIADISNYTFWIIIILIIALIVMILIQKRSDYNNTFILKVLYFKLDELNNESESGKETTTPNETRAKNEANIVNDTDEEENKKYTPYNFNEQIEYNTYLNIGQKHIKEFRKEKAIESKFLRKFKKKKKSKKSVQYLYFDKYTEWETYFKNKFLAEISNKRDFIYYLNYKFRIYQGILDVAKSILTPIFIALITIVLTIYATNGFSFMMLLSSSLVGIIIIMFYLICFVWEYGKKVNFYEDCINIIDSEESVPQ